MIQKFIGSMLVKGGIKPITELLKAVKELFADNTSNRTAERVKEIVLTGLASNNKLIAIDETTFAVASDADISAGDIIFPMIKETTGGSEIYMNLTIKTTTY